jgi:type II secretory pathway pseudopilin PulG
MKNSKLHQKNKKLTKKPKAESGFTLIELLLGMGIFVFLIATVIAIQSLLAQSEEFSLKTVYTIENSNAALRNVTDELRNARQSDAGSFPIELASDQEIIFYSNTDSDEGIERIRYFLDGSELKKGTIDPVGFPVSYPEENEVVKIITEYITNDEDPVFYYYNQDWPADQVNNPLTTPAPLTEVSLVKISIRINADPSQPESEFTLEPFVQVRSLKTNL